MIDDKDKRIDEVLRSLGQVDAPAGLEARMLRRLAAREQQASRPQGWVFAAAFCAALVAAGLGWSAMRLHRGPAVAHSPVSARTVAQTATIVRGDLAGASSIAPSQPSRKSSAHGAFAFAESKPKRAEAGPQAAVPVTVSYFAENAPLTEQERLLVRIAHHPAPDDLQLLNPELREQIARSNAAEFEQFLEHEDELLKAKEEKETTEDVKPAE